MDACFSSQNAKILISELELSRGSIMGHINSHHAGLQDLGVVAMLTSLAVLRSGFQLCFIPLSMALHLQRELQLEDRAPAVPDICLCKGVQSQDFGDLDWSWQMVMHFAYEMPVRCQSFCAA